MIAAVTGTNGKTSTVDFLRQIWRRATWEAASIGTLGLQGPDPQRMQGRIIGLPSLTTPTRRAFTPRCSRWPASA